MFNLSERTQESFLDFQQKMSYERISTKQGNTLKTINFLSLIVIIATLFGSAVWTPSYSQTQILPLGNSITEGIGSSHAGGYRFYLYDLMTNAGESFDFIGSLQAGIGFPDIDHEGHPGIEADELDITAYLTANDPDVILFEIGTNDISNGKDAEEIRDDISVALDTIFAIDPSVEIIISTVIPRADDGALQTATNELNELLPDLIEDKIDGGQNIKLIDTAAQFLADPNWEINLMANSLHPNDDGYALMALSFFNALKDYPVAVTNFFDDFNDDNSLSNSWIAHPAFEIDSEQLINTSTVDAWNEHIAIPNVVVNPNVVEFKYGDLSDEVGRAFTGAAVMLNRADTKANGYLIFKNFNKIRLFTVEDGVPQDEIASVDGNEGEPNAGDSFRVEWISDNAGHHFFTFINGQFDATISDAEKLQGNTTTQYAGIMINGNTDNGVDDVHVFKALDSTPPAAVADLQILSASSSSAELTWTAPGDDGPDGTARNYDLRFADTPIDENNFDDAIQAIGLGLPQAGGTTETSIVSGLQSGLTYYFALKTSDELGNVSDLSNVVSVTTTALSFCSDRFRREGPELGKNWAADSRLQVTNEAIQHTAVIDIWSTAVYTLCRNPKDVTMRWSLDATGFGTNFSGILVMANDFSETPNGYFIQHAESRKKVRLWHIENGQITDLVDEGTAFGPAPLGGSEMKVIVTTTPDAHLFDVFIDGQFDRTLEDPAKLENGSYSGFVMESTLAHENAITSFEAGVEKGQPKEIFAIAGDGQSGRIGEKLPIPLQIALVDSFDNPITDVEIQFTAVQGEALFNQLDNNIRIEAESAQITAPLVVRDDPDASRGSYLVYPAPQPDAGSAVLTFNVATRGTYYIWMRSLTPGNENSNSWTVSIDNEVSFTYDVFQGQRQETWTWDLLSERGNGSRSQPQRNPKTYEWEAGLHTITLEGRDFDARLDKLLITSDPDYIPEGKEEDGIKTNSKGIASTDVTLGNMTGAVIVEARFGSLSPAVFQLFATAGTSMSFVQVSGSGQSGPAGQELLQPFVVQVLDGGGNPTDGGRISWVVSANNGQLETYITESDSNGLAAVSFSPGNLAALNKVEARASFTNQVEEFTATTTNGIASTVELVSGSQQAGAIGSTLASLLVVHVKGTNGESIPNFPLGFTTVRGGGMTSGHNPILNASFEESSNGLPRDWTINGFPTLDEMQLTTEDPVNGQNSLLVNVNRHGIGVSQSIDYAANTNYALTFWAQVDSGLLHVNWKTNTDSGDVQKKVLDITPEATGDDWRLYTVHGMNGTAGKRALSFRTFGSGKFKIDDVRIQTATGSNGQLAVNWTLGDTAGVQEVQAIAINENGNIFGSPVSFEAFATPANAAALAKLSGDAQRGSAGQPLAEAFVVKTSDEFGNGVGGISVLFEMTQGGGSFGDSSQTVTIQTDSIGNAGVVLTLGVSIGVENIVRASVDGLNGSPVLFTAQASAPATLAKVDGDNQLGTAGRLTPAPFIVRVADDGGQPISGAEVQFIIEEGQGTINGSDTASVRTDAIGNAVAWLRLGSIAGGVNRVKAVAVHNNQPLQGSPQNFTARTATLSEMVLVDGDDQIGIAAEALAKPFQVAVIDTLGNTVPQQNVTFAVIEGGGQFGVGTSPQIIQTDTSGIAGITLVLGSLPGVNRVRADAVIPVNNFPVIFRADAKAGPSLVLKRISGDSLAGVVNNQLPESFVVQVTDKVDNPLNGIDVFFEVTAGGGTIGGVISDTVKTDSSGQAQVRLTLGSASGLYNNQVQVHAFNGSLQLQNSPLLFVASAASSNARRLELVAGNNQQGQAGQSVTESLCVRVFDDIGNAVAAHPVRFHAATEADGSFTSGTSDTTVITNQDGLGCVSWILGSAVLPDSQRVLVTANDGIQELQGSPLTFVATAQPGSPASVASTITATSPISADGQTPAIITVFVKDKFGNGIPQADVELFVSGDDNIITQPVKTDSTGKTIGSVTSTKAELKNITARVNDVFELNTDATVRFNSLTATRISLYEGNGQSGNVNTILAEPMCVKVLDQFGNGVAGVNVDFSLEKGDGRIIGQQPVVSDSNGLACVEYVLGSDLVENQVRASSESLDNSPILFVANAVDNPAASMAAESGDEQKGIVLENLLQPIVVQVIDNNKRPVFGTAVTFDVTFGDGTVNNGKSTIVTSDEFGQAKVTWRLGPNAGLNVVRVSANGLEGSPFTFEANAQTGRPTNLIVLSGQNASGPVNQELTTPLVVQVTDENGNGIDGVPVIFELIKGSGELSDSLVQTDNGGQASVTITFDQESGERVIRASSPGLNGSPLFFNVNALPADDFTVKAIDRTNNQSGTADLPLNFPLSVLVADQFGNPIQGTMIDFVVTGGGGHFSNSQSLQAETNAQGIAEALWDNWCR